MMFTQATIAIILFIWIPFLFLAYKTRNELIEGDEGFERPMDLLTMASQLKDEDKKENIASFVSKAAIRMDSQKLHMAEERIKELLKEQNNG